MSHTLPLKVKAIAYVTHGARLLVFRHADFPAAGIQVPAGTVEEGEDPATAVLREAFEETGLTGLTRNAFLGSDRVDMRRHGRDEIHARHFCHLLAPSDVPLRWRHLEMDAGDGSGPLRFDFYWVALTAVPPLSGAQDDWLARLRETL